MNISAENCYYLSLGNRDQPGVPVQVILEVNNPNIAGGYASAKLCLQDSTGSLLGREVSTPIVTISKKGDSQMSFARGEEIRVYQVAQSTISSSDPHVLSFLNAQVYDAAQPGTITPYTVRLKGYVSVVIGNLFSHNIMIDELYDMAQNSNSI